MEYDYDDDKNEISGLLDVDIKVEDAPSHENEADTDYKPKRTKLKRKKKHSGMVFTVAFVEELMTFVIGCLGPFSSKYYYYENQHSQ